MKEHSLFRRFIHEQYGLVRTIDKMYHHPVTGEESVWFKVEVIGSTPTLYYYSKQEDLNEIENQASIS